MDIDVQDPRWVRLNNDRTEAYLRAIRENIHDKVNGARCTLVGETAVPTQTKVQAREKSHLVAFPFLHIH